MKFRQLTLRQKAHLVKKVEYLITTYHQEQSARERDAFSHGVSYERLLHMHRQLAPNKKSW